MSFEKTDRNQVKRIPARGHYDRATIYGILDAGSLCHVGFAVDGQPFVLPTLYGRDNDSVYLHGSAASRMLKQLAGGIPVCLTVTHVDGLVLARSAFHHSMNYRSAVIFGTAVEVTGDEKTHGLFVISEQVLRGRWSEARPPSEQELKATSVLRVEIESASAKIRNGPPSDEEEDSALPIWAGVVPIRQTFGEAEPDAALPDGVPTPASLRTLLGGVNESWEQAVMPDAAFLDATEVVDWTADSIQQLSAALRRQADNETDLARRCFEWVRDNIQHSGDFQRMDVTCRASDVLAKGTGFCYAKSHLLAALLRASGIPAGFCYQRLTVEGDRPPFCLHGLNAVYLPDDGWYRIDARGNKSGVNAQFTPPEEQLAFFTQVAGEVDFPEVWPHPLPVVVEALNGARSLQELLACLPDVSAEQMSRIREASEIEPGWTAPRSF